MYEHNKTYLYEIIEDYKEAESEEEKAAVFDSFTSAIWSSVNKRRIYPKSIHFHVKKDLLNTEPGRLFLAWSDIKYNYYKSTTKDENWDAFLRQKINNLYTRYFDREVILDKEYMDLLKTPKHLYYKWISGEKPDAELISEQIHEAIQKAEHVKYLLEIGKMPLSWNNYKILIEDFLRKSLENCKRIEEYEGKSAPQNRLDFLTEDHFYVSYFNRCLDGELKKWLKKQCGLPQNSRKGYKRCKQCRALIENSGNKKMYCDPCAKLRKRESDRASNLKYKNRKRENRNPPTFL